MNELKIKKQKETRLVLVAVCPFCSKRVRASTRAQMYWNISLHVRQKHGCEPDAKVFLKQLEEQDKVQMKGGKRK